MYTFIIPAHKITFEKNVLKTNQWHIYSKDTIHTTTLKILALSYFLKYF